MNIRHKVRTLTGGPRHHFFGYYSVPLWNPAETHLLCIESEFQDHLPLPGERGIIGLADAGTGEFTPVTTTDAWNLQQGTWLYWNPLAPGREIVHNDRVDGRLVTVLHDIESGERRLLPRPINALSRDGHHALCLDYGRMGRLRKVVGYQGAEDPYPDDPHPKRDGIFRLDMRSGEVTLLYSIHEVWEQLVGRHPELRERHMWFNHTTFNPSGTRFYFLARAWAGGVENTHLQSALYTGSIDGGDLRCLIDFGGFVSHLDWRDDENMAVTCTTTQPQERKTRQHFMLADRAGAELRPMGGGRLDFDGHMTFSPDGRWMVTDCNVNETLEKLLLLVRVEDEAVQVLHRFDMQQRSWLGGDLRCDLHPRWNRSGTQVCVDAIAADGTRQLHVADLELP